MYLVPPDFEAVIRLFSTEEGGRRTPAFNGVRWDFDYKNNSRDLGSYMIWPEFLEETGESWPKDVPLPIGVEIRALMYILDDELRESAHRERLLPGVQFWVIEGSRRVGEGWVLTKVN